MTYYDELLVDQKASIEDIQKSYKRLTRLLHPDLHSDDPRLEAFAEVQMKRLHEIIAVLSDAEKRRQYDESIAFRFLASVDSELECGADCGPAAKSHAARAEPVKFLYLLIGIGLGFFMGYLPNSGWNKKEFPVISSVQADTELLSDQVMQKSDKAAKRTGRTTPASPPGTHAVEAETAPGTLPAIETAALAPDLPVLPAAALAPAPGSCAGCDRAKFAGAWLYARQSRDAEESLYPPEYIEMRVSENDGTVRGTYRARYRIADRLIAPDVVFEFRGPAGGAEALLDWKGSSGSKGEVKLRRLTDNTMEVSWYVTQFATDSELGAGTAVLVRRSE